MLYWFLWKRNKKGIMKEGRGGKKGEGKGRV